MDCRYITSATKPEQLPNYEQPEIAFIGRSNTGKSTLINSVLGRRKLARHGRTPGQTQMINFFTVADQLVIADLPGYGFSAIDRNVAQSWEPLIEAYMRRPNIKEFLFLLDVRRDMNDMDKQLIYRLGRNLPVYVVLTKADKISRNAVLVKTKEVAKELALLGVDVRKIHAVSSLRQVGIQELKDDILAYLPPPDSQSI